MLIWSNEKKSLFEAWKDVNDEPIEYSYLYNRGDSSSVVLGHNLPMDLISSLRYDKVLHFGCMRNSDSSSNKYCVYCDVYKELRF